MKSKIDNYQKQSGCHNCKHVFVQQEHDGPDYYFCTDKAPPRPKCGSVFLQETWDSVGDPDDVLWNKQYRAWERWSRSREVKAWGRCNFWGKP